MRDKWLDVERMMQEITHDYTSIHDSTVQNTLEVLSIADYWKHKLTKEKDNLKLSNMQKDDEINKLLNFKAQLELHIAQLNALLKTAREESQKLERSVLKKDEHIIEMQRELKLKERSFRQLELDIISFQEQHQGREIKLVNQVETLSDQYTKLVETYSQNEEILQTIIDEKKKKEKMILKLEKDVAKANERKEVLKNKLEQDTKDFNRRMRDMLAIVSANMQFAETRFKIDKSLREVLHTVSANVNNIIDAVNEHEFLTVIPNMHMRPTYVNTLVKDASAMLSEKAKRKGIEFAHYFGAQIPEIQIDQELMTQCLLHVISNAIEAVSEKGNIIIYTTRNIPEKKVIIKIFDNGAGCHERNIPHIYEAHFTAEKGSCGMGLTLAKRIMELHKGSIQLMSVPGKGTAVTLTLPEYTNE
ncbi:MAG: ATP-binding protein [bacterium]